MRDRYAHASVLAAMVACLVSLGATGSALAQASRQEDPIPTDLSQDLTAIERLFKPSKPPPLTAFPELRERWKDTPAFLRDSKMSLQARSYFRDAVNQPAGSNLKQAWASGGSFSAETGKLFDILNLGAVLYTSFPVVAPSQYGNTGLLLPDQAGYAVFGQLYAQAHLWEEHRVTIGRSAYNSPFLGQHDNRMSPNTFSGYTLIGTFGGEGGNDGDGPSLLYGLGYIDAIKPRDAVTFRSMASAAGVPTSNAGVGVAGGLLSWGRAKIGAINYYSQDLLNIFYTEGKYGMDLGGGFGVLMAAQFVAQNSTGQASINSGKPFATNQLGMKVNLGFETGILTLAYSTVNPGFEILTPWSGNPFYTNGLIQGFQRAGEQTVMIGLSHTLKRLGMPQFALSAHFFNGWTSAATVGGPLAESEWDFHIDWRPEHRPLRGLWFRTQYGRSTVWQGGSVTNADELRIVLNYDLKLY